MSHSENHIFTKLLKATSSPSTFAHYLPKFLAELSNPAPLSQSAKASDLSFLDSVSEIITSKSSKPLQKFHCLYLLLKLTEFPEKTIFMTRLTANDELIRYIFHASQTEMAAREVYFNERGRGFFGCNGSKVQQQQGVNFVRLAYEMIIYWGNSFGNADSNHGLYIYHFLGESLKKKCKLPVRFQFLNKDFDVECDLSSWNFKLDDPPLAKTKSKSEVKTEEASNEAGSLRVLTLISNSSQEGESPIVKNGSESQPKQTSMGSDKTLAEDTPRRSPRNLKVQTKSSLSIFEEPCTLENIEDKTIGVSIELTPKINILQANGKQNSQAYTLRISECEIRTPKIEEKSFRKSSQGIEMDLLKIGENIQRSASFSNLNHSSGSHSVFRSPYGSSARSSLRSSIRSPQSFVSFGSPGNEEIRRKGSENISRSPLSKRSRENTSFQDEEGLNDMARITFGATVQNKTKKSSFSNILDPEEEKNNSRRSSQRSGNSFLEAGSEQNIKKYDPFAKSPLPEQRIPGQYNVVIGTANSRKSGDFTHVKSPYLT